MIEDRDCTQNTPFFDRSHQGQDTIPSQLPAKACLMPFPLNGTQWTRQRPEDFSAEAERVKP